MIRFEKVTKVFGEGATEVRALREFSLDVPAQQFCSIMGPSGSGKSTVLHLLAGLTKPTSGEIYLSDRPLSRMTERDASMMRRRDLGFIFQFFHLLPYLSAEENIALPLFLDGHSPEGVREEAKRLVVLVGLEHRRHHKPTELSGGEMQRVAIARALITKPRVILADEPTGNLDTTASHDIMRLLRRSSEQLGVTVLMVSHDPVCASYGDRIVRVVDGQLVEDIDVSEHDEQPLQSVKSVGNVVELRRRDD
jgi:putative ABC transport system ATP-binding protein